MLSAKKRSMARLVINNNVTSGGCLASGQTLRFGSFTMRARAAVEPATPLMAVGHRPRIGPKYSEKLDPADVSSLNELLDRIATLGVSTDYDRIGLKPDLREINSPSVTHQIAVVEEQNKNSSPILRMNYVWIPELSEPDTHLREDMA